ncbi:MAG TPA: hypothetical protein VFZ59_08935 [Verrucomicrobiae bacterium]|nr:hypothetical protein [Verrucomicrobiae bacterium]
MTGTFLRLILLLTVSTASHAAVTTVAWYRLGDNDPGAAPGIAVSGFTSNLTGIHNLLPFGAPRYTDHYAAAAAAQVGSRLAINFNGTSQYLSNGIVSSAVDNFGLEAWVKPDATSGGKPHDRLQWQPRRPWLGLDPPCRDGVSGQFGRHDGFCSGPRRRRRLGASGAGAG